MHRKKQQLRLGIIGCGAVVKLSHLPALKKSPLFKLEMLIDKDEDALKDLCQQYKINAYSTDFRDCFDKIDAVIVALPHYLHASVSIELLKHGIHVLCEKPMATNYLHSLSMIKAAARHSSILSLSCVRRFYWSSHKVKEFIENGSLGRLRSINCEEGAAYDWPTVSGFFFSKEYAGGGVTIDTGGHLFDLLLWWLGKYPDRIDYKDDNFCGVEAESEMKIFFSSEVEARVRMSRLVPLKNVYELDFERGKIIYSFSNFDRVVLVKNGTRTTISSSHKRSIVDYFRIMLEDFALAVIEKRSPLVSGDDGARVVKLIEECYTKKGGLIKPWLLPKT